MRKQYFIRKIVTHPFTTKPQTMFSTALSWNRRVALTWGKFTPGSKFHPPRR